VDVPEDAPSFFYQWQVKIGDRQKLTVVSHRGQESSMLPSWDSKTHPHMSSDR